MKHRELPIERSVYDLAADILAPPKALGAKEWVAQTLGETLWSKQVEVANSVRDHRRTAVKSCHSAGKSFTASRIVAWWLSTHRPGSAFVVTSAPTFDQVKAVLWREIGKAHEKGHLFGRVNQTNWFLGERELVAIGRKPADDDGTAFQGIHSEYVLVVLDEACGIPRTLWESAHSLASNEKSRILAIGNPDDPASYFFNVCEEGSGWNVIKIGYMDTPNFTGETVPYDLRSLLISQNYVEEMRLDVGEGSAPWLAKVMGEFPQDASDGVISHSDVRKCMRGEQFHSAEALVPVELGWDVGAGGDKSVVRERRGMVAARTWYPRGKDLMAQCSNVLGYIAETGATAIKIDSVGIGHGAADRMEELRRSGAHQARVIRVNVGTAANKPHRFPRLRDEIWWEVGRNLSASGGWDLSAIDDATVAQLTAPKYENDPAGRIKVEPKEETKKRLGRSPDDADALLLAFYSGKGQGAAFAEMWRATTDQNEVIADPAVRQLHRMFRRNKARADGMLAVERRAQHRCQHVWRGKFCVKCGVKAVEQ